METPEQVHEKTRYFYDSIAEHTFENWFNNNMLSPLLARYVAQLPKNARVLDLGCGIGGETMRLLNLGVQVSGIDFSEKSIELAREHVHGAAFYVMDIRKMTFESNSFDGVLDAAVMFHFSEQEQSAIITNIYEMLTDNGIFLSIYPEGSAEGIEKIEIDGQEYQRYARFLPIEAWCSLVSKAGFSRFDVIDFEFENFKAVEFYK